MRNVAVVQARMGSTRFPGKVLHKIAGKAIIDRVLAGLERSCLLDDVVVATTNEAADDILWAHLRNVGAKVIRGPTNDVLRRFSDAVCFGGIGEDCNIVRITADCPLINGSLIDRVIDLKCTSNFHYASNVHPALYPDGFDVEVFSAQTLRTADLTPGLKPSDREHVTPFIWRSYNTVNLGNPAGDFSHLRVTVDHPDDADYIEVLGQHLDLDTDISCYDLQVASLKVAWLGMDNRNHRRNEGYELSLRTDVQSGV